MLKFSKFQSRFVVRFLRRSLQNARLFSEASKLEGEDTIDERLKRENIADLLAQSASFNETTDSTWLTSPYTTTAPDEGTNKRVKIDPKETSIILLPGQGMIKVGAAKEYLKFPKVKELFDIASEELGHDILQICLKGPQERLNSTDINQPATVILSLAALEKLQEERPKVIESCVAIAGYSVGELTALIFSGAISLETGIRLVGVRASAMQCASEESSQGMLTAFCTARAKISDICKEAQTWAKDLGAANPVCSLAAYLYTQGKVIAGCTEALDYIEKNSRNLGLRNIQRLPVSGAFHTSMMTNALEPFKSALHTIQLSKTIVPVYSNYTSHPYNCNEKRMKENLIKHIVSPVKWEQIMHNIYKRNEQVHYPRTFDVGSGGGLKTILKNINMKAFNSCYVY